MARTFLPKTEKISEDAIKRLKEEYCLSEEEIFEIEDWNGLSSYSGTIINTNKGAHYKVYPFHGSKEFFLEQYPDGEIWK